MYPERKGFTLIELLLTIAVVAVLSVTVLVILNPVELLKKSRDSQRKAETLELKKAVALYQFESSGSLGDSTVAYISLPDTNQDGTCDEYTSSLPDPSVFNKTSFHCADKDTFRNVDGNGWVPLNFKVLSSGSPYATLPVDPRNDASSFYVYGTSAVQSGEFFVAYKTNDVPASAIALSCGNGTIDNGEECDGSALGGETCTTISGGYTGGTLGCIAKGQSNECKFDTSSCTTGGPDTQSPNAPSGFANTATTNTVNLNWNDSADLPSGFATGYSVYRATISGGPYTGVASTTASQYTDSGRSPGVTYYYLVNAYDAAGNPSANSAEQSVRTNPDMLVQYNFESGSGAVVNTGSGGATYHSTMNGNTAYTTTAKLGNYAATFDTNGDYIGTKWGSGVSASSTPFSVTGWVYKTEQCSTVEHHTWGTRTGTNQRFYTRCKVSGSPYWSFRVAGIADTYATNAGAVALNTWYHLAMVMDGTTARLYVNGTESVTASYSAYALAAENLFLGAANSGGLPEANTGAGAIIDDFRIYLGALTASEISNIMAEAAGGADVIPPGAVSDLRVLDKNTSSMTIAWTSPGDDNNTGTATSYDVRYATTTITAGNWNSVTQATGEPLPQVANTTQNLTITGLTPNTTYYFAMKTSDEVPNISGLSNVVSTSTLPLGDTTAPTLSNGAPISFLDEGTTQANLALTTNENATCKYATSSGVSYGAMANMFSTTGGTSHQKNVTGLQNSQAYSYFVRCQDASANVNTQDYLITFAIRPFFHRPISTGNTSRHMARDTFDASGVTWYDPAQKWLNVIQPFAEVFNGNGTYAASTNSFACSGVTGDNEGVTTVSKTSDVLLVQSENGAGMCRIDADDVLDGGNVTVLEDFDWPTADADCSNGSPSQGGSEGVAFVPDASLAGTCRYNGFLLAEDQNANPAYIYKYCIHPTNNTLDCLARYTRPSCNGGTEGAALEYDYDNKKLYVMDDNANATCVLDPFNFAGGYIQTIADPTTGRTNTFEGLSFGNGYFACADDGTGGVNDAYNGFWLFEDNYCGDGKKVSTEQCDGTDGVGVGQACTAGCVLINL